MNYFSIIIIFYSYNSDCSKCGTQQPYTMATTSHYC